jgi:hypothetical protein
MEGYRPRGWMSLVWKTAMSLIKHLLEKPRSLSQDAKYTVLNGVAYMAVGTLLIAWPGVTQAVF